MIAWALIGAVVGLLLGLTGAGGAVIAVPLFIQLADVSLQQATVFSLYAVLAGAAFNWSVQRGDTELGTSFLLAAFSLAGSQLVAGWKPLAPPAFVKGLFIAVCLASLLTIWRQRSSKAKGFPLNSPPTSRPMSRTTRAAQAAAGGVFLGGIVTMTGLGGGVILVPLLAGPLGLSMNRAAATSLLTITLASLISLWVQRTAVLAEFDPSRIAALVAGSIGAASLTRAALMRIHARKMDSIRRWIVTGVILFSVTSLLLK